VDSDLRQDSAGLMEKEREGQSFIAEINDNREMK
jgi:hypothetical protein